MEIEIAMDRQLVAQHALIIYGYEKDPRYEEPANSIDHYVTKHRVDGEGRLLEGAPLTREMLHKICSLVIPSLQTMEYIPEKVLAYSPGTAILWWTPGVSRRVFFTKETGLRSGTYPLPATLFLVVNRALHTWALATTVRPEPGTAIYHSPFFNVYEGGTCCMGNIELPRNASPGDINDLGKGILRRRLQRPHRAEAARDRALRAMEDHRGKDRIPQRVSRPLRRRARTSSNQQRKGGRHGHKSERPSYPGTIPHHYGAQVRGTFPRVRCIKPAF